MILIRRIANVIKKRKGGRKGWTFDLSQEMKQLSLFLYLKLHN